MSARGLFCCPACRARKAAVPAAPGGITDYGCIQARELPDITGKSGTAAPGPATAAAPHAHVPPMKEARLMAGPVNVRPAPQAFPKQLWCARGSPAGYPGMASRRPGHRFPSFPARKAACPERTVA